MFVINVTDISCNDIRDENGYAVISFSVDDGTDENNINDAQFKLVQTEELTELGVAVYDYGCIIIPISVMTTKGTEENPASITLNVELTGSFSGLYNADISLSKLATVGSSVQLSAIS